MIARRVECVNPPSVEEVSRFRSAVVEGRYGAVAAEMERRRARRTGRRTARCRPCGRFKPRPSSECGYCGDRPLTHNGDSTRGAWEYDRAHGWDW